MLSLQRLTPVFPKIHSSSLACFSSSVPSEKVKINPIVTNRNPRNLERLRIAWRPQGFHLETPGRSYWHKLVLNESSRQIVAQVIHHTGKVVVEASTTEWCIRKHLYSAKDKSAFYNLAKIVAKRCLECGIIEMDNGIEIKDHTSKAGNFARIMEEEGISLKEPSRYQHAYPYHQLRPEKPWLVTEENHSQ